MMSLSYSKISLDAIAAKLQLDSAVDAEFIVAKVSLNEIILLLDNLIKSYFYLRLLEMALLRPILTTNRDLFKLKTLVTFTLH